MTLFLFVSVHGNGQRRVRRNTSSLNCTDTTTYTVIPFSRTQFNNFPSPFNDSCAQAALDSAEINQLESLIKKGISAHNADVPNQKYPYISEFIPYRKQYVPVINSKGEKIVWINCFCSAWGDFCEEWKKTIIQADDGGSCYFNLKINLTTGIIYDFFVNGIA